MTGQGRERCVSEVHGVGLEHRRGTSGTGGSERLPEEGGPSELRCEGVTMLIPNVA